MSPLPSDSYNLSASVSFSIEHPELWGEGFDEDITFMTECSKISYSLHIIQLWGLGTSSPLLQEEVSLMMVEQDTDL